MRPKEILSYFSLEGNPFTKEIKTDDLMSLPAIEKAAGQLNMLLETRGIGLFTGPSGTGKSSLIRKIASEMNPGYTVRFISATRRWGRPNFIRPLPRPWD